MGRTSTEVKSRWESANYKKYMVRLRVEDDKELIDFIEANKDSKGTSAIFKEALEKLVKEQGK